MEANVVYDGHSLDIKEPSVTDLALGLPSLRNHSRISLATCALQFRRRRISECVW
jgi:hypothetical protein